MNTETSKKGNGRRGKAHKEYDVHVLLVASFISFIVLLLKGAVMFVFHYFSLSLSVVAMYMNGISPPASDACSRLNVLTLFPLLLDMCIHQKICLFLSVLPLLSLPLSLLPFPPLPPRLLACFNPLLLPSIYILITSRPKWS